MSEAIDAIRDERNHWIGEAKKFERCWKYAEESNRDWIKRRNEERKRAERAEAELAALRERVMTRAWAFDAMGQHVHAEGLMDLLDDDTTGAASGEGEK